MKKINFILMLLCTGSTVQAQTGPACNYLNNLTGYHMVFTDGNVDANWQGASKGFAGNVAVNGITAAERTSGDVPYAGTVYTNDNTLGAWQKIVNANAGQASAALNQGSLLTGLEGDLENAFSTINALPVTPGYTGVSAASLNNLNVQNGIGETFVINVTSGFNISTKINITGDAADLFILRWDNDANFSNGYDGQVKFQSGGAIVPQGGLTVTNFISVAGDIAASGGGTTPPAPYPQGPRFGNGSGSLINGGADFKGGGFFTGYWLTTGSPDIVVAGEQPYGPTSSLSNAIFVGSWYSKTTKFSMTSGTSGVYVNGCRHVNPRIGKENNTIVGGAGVFAVAAMPNPSTGYFTLQITGNGTEPIRVRLVDLTGKLISTTTLDGTATSVSLGSDLKAGMYIAEVAQGNNVQVVKLVKMN